MERREARGQLRIIAVTDPGCEDPCASEIALLLGRPRTEASTRACIAEIGGSWEDAALLAYRAQVALRILVAIAPTARDIDSLIAQPPDAELLAQALPEGGAFKAEGELFDPALMPQELVEGVGAWVHSAGLKVNLSKPDLVIVGVATPDGVDAGIDMVGAPLSKREWRVMLSSKSIKGTIAAATAIFAGIGPKHAVLDPFGDDGSIGIEAAMLLSGVSPRRFTRSLSFTRFPVLQGAGWAARKAKIDAETREDAHVTVLSDTLRDAKSVRTNAKLAGVDKLLRSTKISMDWVDAKFEEASVDRVVTAPITSGKVISPQRAAKLADQLFWQAAFILRKGGTVTCLTEKPQELDAPAKEHGFRQQARHDVRMGQRPLAIVTYARVAKSKS